MIFKRLHWFAVHVQTRDMQIQISINVIATIIVLGLSTIISASVFQGPPTPDPVEGDSTTVASNSSNDTALERNSTTIASNFNDAEFSCALCLSSSSQRNIKVMVEDKELYMFVDIPSNKSDTCCNVLAKHANDSTDIRGKREKCTYACMSCMCR